MHIIILAHGHNVNLNEIHKWRQWESKHMLAIYVETIHFIVCPLATNLKEIIFWTNNKFQEVHANAILPSK